MPGQFDGYVTDTEDGRFEASFAGVMLGVHAEEQDAADAVREAFAGDAQCWRVALDGETMPL